MLVARAANSKNSQSQKIDLSEEFGGTNVEDEVRRYNNFWIGVKKSIQLKKNLKCEIDKSLLKRFKKMEVSYLRDRDLSSNVFTS